MEYKYSELNNESKKVAVDCLITHEQEKFKTQYPLLEVAKKMTVDKLKLKGFTFKEIEVDFKNKKIQLISGNKPYNFIKSQLQNKEKEAYEKLSSFRRIDVEVEFDDELTKENVLQLIIQRSVLGEFFFNPSNDRYYDILKEELNFVLDYDNNGTVKDRHRLLGLFKDELDPKKMFTGDLSSSLADDVALVGNQYTPGINHSLNTTIKELCNEIFDLYNEAYNTEVMKKYYNRFLEVNEESYGHRYKFKENGEITNFKD